MKFFEDIFFKKAICILVIVLQFVTVFAQPKSNKFIDPREAEEHFSHNNFIAAIPIYRQLVKQEPENIDYNHKLGICYLYTNINKSLAIPYLEAASKQEKMDKNIWFDLGLSYQYASRFDDAIKAYNKLLVKLKAGPEFDRVVHQIESCENGKEYVKHPINVSFQNLGKDVNSEYPDYYPFVPADESFIIFTSRRKECIGGAVEVDGYYSSDIFISTPLNDAFSKPKNMGPLVNTRYDEQTVSLASDGQLMIMYIDHIDSFGNIYSSTNKAGIFQRMKKLNSNVNSDYETAGSISPDGEKIYFASKRAGGQGETDIYISRKLPNGQWAMAQNLGPAINTKYSEDFPEIAPDGKTLYFSSQGHDGMGDYDLFKTTWNEADNTWSNPKNLGYPINSAGDDRCISFTQDNRVAYVSAVRDGGFGDLDLYRVKFEDAEDKTTLMFGYVATSDSSKNIDAIVTITDLKNKDILPYTYTPIPKSGKFIMSLNPSKYQITIESGGYKPFSEVFFIFDIGIGQNETKKTFILQK